MVLGWLISLFFVLGLGSGFLFPGKPVLIADPKPTHVEKNFITLEVVAQVGPEIDKEHFFARPTQLKVNSKGNIFVFDDLLNKIFIFDQKLKLVRVFGNVGRGPGDMTKFGLGGIEFIYIRPDDKLYISDPGNRKILVFDAGGNHITDMRFPFNTQVSYYPVVDKKNNFYRISEKGGAVDILDNNLNIVSTLLSSGEYERFIVRIPVENLSKSFNPSKKPDTCTWCRPDTLNTYYDVFAEDGLLIYLSNYSTVFVFKGNRLVKRFDLHPREALKNYRYRVNRLKKKLKEDSFYTPIFSSLFIDQDNQNYFFLRGPNDEKKRLLFYKFSMDGSLNSIYFIDKTIQVLQKKNNYFYGLDIDGYVYILKENQSRGEK
jgi:hypothetical protein